MGEPENRGVEPKVPTERPDRDAAERPPAREAQDRPGFDLGGAEDTSVPSATKPRTEPRGNPELGDQRPTSGSGMTSNKGTPA